MANPPKKKGTAGETELRRKLMRVLPFLRRTEAGEGYDLHQDGRGGPPLELLATRPDQGEWLITMRLEDFEWLYWSFYCYKQPRAEEPPVHIEVKRYRRFALHAIWEKKFGEKK